MLNDIFSNFNGSYGKIADYFYVRAEPITMEGENFVYRALAVPWRRGGVSSFDLDETGAFTISARFTRGEDRMTAFLDQPRRVLDERALRGVSGDHSDIFLDRGAIAAYNHYVKELKQSLTRNRIKWVQLPSEHPD